MAGASDADDDEFGCLGRWYIRPLTNISGLVACIGSKYISTDVSIFGCVWIYMCHCLCVSIRWHVSAMHEPLSILQCSFVCIGISMSLYISVHVFVLLDMHSCMDYTKKASTTVLNELAATAVRSISAYLVHPTWAKPGEYTIVFNPAGCTTIVPGSFGYSFTPTGRKMEIKDA